MDLSTETLRNVSNFVLIAGLFIAALGTYGVNHFRGRLEKEKEAVAEKRREDQATKEADLHSKVQDLLEGNKQLQQKLAPFEAMARERYPAEPASAGLERLGNDLRDLQTRASQIESRIAMRSVTPGTESSVLEILKPHAGSRVRLLSPVGDTEAYRLALELQALLEKAGWTVQGVEQGFFDRAMFGVQVRILEPPPTPATIALIEALGVAGLSPEYSRNPGVQVGVPELIVGGKR